MKFRRFRKTNPDAPPSEWVTLLKALWARLCRPLFQPAYVLYFASSMIIGATGIWVAIGELWLTAPVPTPLLSLFEDPGIFKSFLTFFAALGSVSCIHIIVVEDQQKHLRTLFSLFLVMLVFLAIAAAFFEGHRSGAGYLCLAVGTILAIVTWWMAYWEPGKFEQQTTRGPLGADSEEPAAGDTGGYRL